MPPATHAAPRGWARCSKVVRMKLWSLIGNSQRLDGGAMFGNAPRVMWSRWVAPDAENRIPLACRCLLVTGLDGRNVLFETGIGAFFDPAMRERFGVVEDRHVLLDSLAEVGLSHEDIDAVVLSHLHFDHASGRLELVEAGRPSSLGEAVRFEFSEGHTPGLMLAEVGGVVFCADLIPG